MEEALLERLRTATAIIAVAGTFNGRPAIDFDERQSNDETAFPAAILTIVSSGRLYDQDQTSALRRPRIRFEVFGTSYGQAKLLARVIEAVVEVAGTVGTVRFHRGMMEMERDGGIDDIPGGLRVSRIIIDFIIPATIENEE